MRYLPGGIETQVYIGSVRVTFLSLSVAMSTFRPTYLTSMFSAVMKYSLLLLLALTGCATRLPESSRSRIAPQDSAAGTIYLIRDKPRIEASVFAGRIKLLSPGFPLGGLARSLQKSFRWADSRNRSPTP